jgi:hypothetical protein
LIGPTLNIGHAIRGWAWSKNAAPLSVNVEGLGVGSPRERQ